MLEKIKLIPEKPGCYIYYDIHDIVIYVGKAKNLKKRMSSYFNRANNTKTEYLVSKIARFDYFITKTENEALILENNLIKKYTPFYNIVLKDDKKYPYVVLTKEENPRLIKTRNRNIKGDYFGPFSSSTFATMLINYLEKKTTLRKCIQLPKTECIYYHMKLCYAPCIKSQKFDKEIQKNIKYIKNLLANNMIKLKKQLKVEMEELVAEMRFEDASEYRDMLSFIDEMRKKQAVQLSDKIKLNVLNYYKDENFISLAILEIEKGKLINIHRTLIPYYDNAEEELTSYLSAYYQKNDKPDFFATDKNLLADAVQKLLFIEQKKYRSLEYKQLLEISLENAEEYYRKNINKITSDFFVEKDKGYKELQKITNNKLERIEIYDISHLGGDAQVGAMVVYKEGKKNNKEYRKYKIKEEKNIQNDYGSLTEVLTRRIRRGFENSDLPNLIVVDGGKGQVRSFLNVLEEFNLADKIMLMGVSKDNNHKTKGMINKNMEEIILDKNGDLYKFLYDMQEEVHRFAISFHRELKSKSLFQSKLDAIPGIGPKRKMQLLESFEYLANIEKATKNEIQMIGIPKKLAAVIYEYFQKKR